MFGTQLIIYLAKVMSQRGTSEPRGYVRTTSERPVIFNITRPVVRRKQPRSRAQNIVKNGNRV